MDSNHVVVPVDQLPDENDIERLFPKCPPKTLAAQVPRSGDGQRGSLRPARGGGGGGGGGPCNDRSQRRQARHKVHQHSRRELETRRRMLTQQQQQQSQSLNQDNGHSSDSSFNGGDQASRGGGNHNGSSNGSNSQYGTSWSPHQQTNASGARSSSSAGTQRRASKYTASQSLLQQLKRSQSSYNSSSISSSNNTTSNEKTDSNRADCESSSNSSNRVSSSTWLDQRSLIVKATPPESRVSSGGIVKSASSFAFFNERQQPQQQQQPASSSQQQPVQRQNQPGTELDSGTRVTTKNDNINSQSDLFDWNGCNSSSSSASSSSSSSSLSEGGRSAAASLKGHKRVPSSASAVDIARPGRLQRVENGQQLAETNLDGGDKTFSGEIQVQQQTGSTNRNGKLFVAEEITVTDASLASTPTSVSVSAKQTADSKQMCEKIPVGNNKREPANSANCSSDLISTDCQSSQQAGNQQLWAAKPSACLDNIPEFKHGKQDPGSAQGTKDDDYSNGQLKDDDDKYINLFVYDNATNHLQKSQTLETTPNKQPQLQQEQHNHNHHQQQHSKARKYRRQPRGKRSSSNRSSTDRNKDEFSSIGFLKGNIEITEIIEEEDDAKQTNTSPTDLLKELSPNSHTLAGTSTDLHQSGANASPSTQFRQQNSEAQQTASPGVVPLHHHASQELLGNDLHDNDDASIVRHDASTEELCHTSDSLDETRKPIESKKDQNLEPASSSILKHPDFETSSGPISSAINLNRTLNHRAPPTSVGVLQTVDEKAEINCEELINESEQRNDNLEEENNNFDKIEHREQVSDTMPANQSNLTKKGFVLPGHPQRIRPQTPVDTSSNLSRQPITISGGELISSKGPQVKTEIKSTTPAGILSPRASFCNNDADTLERGIRSSKIENQRVKFDEENLVSVRNDKCRLDQQQSLDSSEKSHIVNSGNVRKNSEHPLQMPSISEAQFETENETARNNMLNQSDEYRDLSTGLAKISLEARSDISSRTVDETTSIPSEDVKQTQQFQPLNREKISNSHPINTSTSETPPPPQQQQLISIQQHSSLSPESSKASTFETNPRVPNLRHHKLPNETSHYSIVRTDVANFSNASNNSINIPSKTSSIQFNTLSDGESGPEDELIGSRQLTDATKGSYPHHLAKKCDSSQLTSQLAINRNNVGFSGNYPLTKSGSSNSGTGTNANNDDDLMPTTKTALIFPRLDEGLSSEPESCDDGVEDDDEKAMEADVDADDDEDDDDDDDDDDNDNDIVDDLENDNLSLDRNTLQISQSSVDCFLRQQQQQQQQQQHQLSKAQNRLIGSPSQQQHGGGGGGGSSSAAGSSSSIIGMLPDQSELHHQVKSSSSSTFGGYVTATSQEPLDHNDLKSVAGYLNQNGQSNYWMGVANQQHPSPNLSPQQPSSHQQQQQPQQQPQHYNQRNHTNSGSNQIPNKNSNSFNRDEAKAANRLSSDTDNETDRLLGSQRNDQLKITSNDINSSNNSTDLQPVNNVTKSNSNSREVLIEGVLFNVKYLGSTHSDCEGRSEKEDRIHQAEMAVHEVKYRNGEAQSAVEVQLFISTEKIMVLDDKHRKIMMDHSLRTISYIADIGDAIVLIVRKKNSNSNDVTNELGRPISKISCHVFESSESHTITKSISQAFQVAYTELLKANGTGDTSSYLPKELDYQEVLNSQEMSTDELEMFARKENQREVIVPKKKGEILGLSIVESGWGSVLPTVVIANLKPDGPAYRCKKLSIGDQILSVNGISLVGLPMAECQEILRKTKKQSVARLSVVPCPITVEVKIKRPDTKYQLGFSVQNGVICSLLRGGIAERGGVRVGHRIMSINGTAVVGVPHEKIVTLLASSVGEIRMKTCLTSLYRLILGEEKAVHF